MHRPSPRNEHKYNSGDILCAILLFVCLYTLIIAQLALAAGRHLGCAGQ